MANLVVCVGGSNSDLEVRGQDGFKPFVHETNSETGRSITQRDSISSASETNSVLANRSQNHSTVHIRTSEHPNSDHHVAHSSDGYTDDTDDTDDGCIERYTGNGNIGNDNIGEPWKKVPMLIDGHEPQAVVFRPSHRFNDGSEAVLGRNSRKVSPAADIQDAGHYSGIVRVEAAYKVFGDLVLYERKETQGTGIVINNQHIMTVAHNVWHEQYGPAIAIAIRQDCRADPCGSDHYHHVEIASVHYSWTTRRLKQNDFAILRVSVPLPDKIKPMQYNKTPVENSVDTVVYGFSSGLREKDALYYSRAKAQYVAGQDSLVFHDGDTSEGASGGPVVDSTGAVIAIHRGYDEVSSVDDVSDVSCVNNVINQAVVINYHGNDVQNFIDALALGAKRSPVSTWRMARGAAFVFRASQVTFVGWDRRPQHEDSE